MITLFTSVIYAFLLNFSSQTCKSLINILFHFILFILFSHINYFIFIHIAKQCFLFGALQHDFNIL